jgi:hypothetical protein
MPPIISGPTTMLGNVYSNAATGEANPALYFTALDGPPQIKQAFSSVIAKYYPATGSMNAAQARTLEDQFIAQLTYNVDGADQSNLLSLAQYTVRNAYELTGSTAVKNGGTWLTITADMQGNDFQYPAHMMDPDVPLVMPSKPNLVLNVGSTTMTFIHVAPGSFLMGEPRYMIPTWMEDPPHVVTLTKGYYLAETPITWALYQAATGTDLRLVNGSGNEDLQSAANVSCANVYAFAKALAKSSGRTVRPPTAAELVYAFRVGTSNPPFVQKVLPSMLASMTGPVKATPPNPWGFFEWMTDEGWERSGDSPVSDHQDTMDPKYTPPEDLSDPTQPHQHAGYGRAEYAIGELEYIGNTSNDVNTYPNLMRERVLVEE